MAQIEEWLGQDVLDSAGERVGKLDDVYYGDESQDAVFVVIKSGLLGRRSALAPLSGASVGRDYIRLAYSGEQIDAADAGGSGAEVLPAAEAQRIGGAYGLQLGEHDLASASAINARREAAAQAADRADSLADEAGRGAVEAEQAQGEARSASADASQKAAEAQRAKEEADRARTEADRISPD